MTALLVTLLALQAAPESAADVRDPAPIAARVELPTGPPRDAWEAAGAPPLSLPGPRVGVFTPPDARLEVDPADRGWRNPITWTVWGWTLTSETATPYPGKRDVLAQLALLQGRWDDAWEHFAHASAPRTLLASFLPGLPAGKDAGPLQDGVLLRPAMPPPSPDAEPGYWDVREAWVRGLKLGDAVLDLRVAMEPEGVQVDVEHVSGGDARFQVQLPVPEGFEIRVEYVDWLRQDEVGLPLSVEVHPGDETHSLYGRLLPRSPQWPTGAVEHVPAALELGGLWLLTSDDDPERKRLALAANALGEGCRVTTEPPELGVVVHLPPPGDERDEKLAWLASQVERLALDGR